MSHGALFSLTDVLLVVRVSTNRFLDALYKIENPSFTNAMLFTGMHNGYVGIQDSGVCDSSD